MRTSHRRFPSRAGLAAVAIAIAVLAGGASDTTPAPRSGRSSIAELWIEPTSPRDLFTGVGGRRLMPDPTELFKVIEIKASGFSDGYTLVDSRGREWSAKFPPEAHTEIVASRLFWGVGYHQPPAHLLTQWKAAGAIDPNPQRPARFRAKAPDFHGLDDKGGWAYDDNPFVGTRQLQGLLVLQAMLGNSDLKAENNALYELDPPVEGAARWYVARDLGQTFGRTGRLDPPRGDIEAFEQTPFIRKVDRGRVELEYHGRHGELFDRITVDDVVWICRRLNRLTDRQWHDAFRAGGIDAPTAARFIRRMKAKIAEGLRLSSSERRPS